MGEKLTFDSPFESYISSTVPRGNPTTPCSPPHEFRPKTRVNLLRTRTLSVGTKGAGPQRVINVKTSQTEEVLKDDHFRYQTCSAHPYFYQVHDGKRRRLPGGQSDGITRRRVSCQDGELMEGRTKDCDWIFEDHLRNEDVLNVPPTEKKHLLFQKETETYIVDVLDVFIKTTKEHRYNRIPKHGISL